MFLLEDKSVIQYNKGDHTGSAWKRVNIETVGKKQHLRAGPEMHLLLTLPPPSWAPPKLAQLLNALLLSPLSRSPAVRNSGHQALLPQPGNLPAPSHIFISLWVEDSHINYFFHVCSALPVFSGNSRINYLLCLLSFQLHHRFLPSASLSAHLPCIISPQILHFKIKFFIFLMPTQQICFSFLV